MSLEHGPMTDQSHLDTGISCRPDVLEEEGLFTPGGCEEGTTCTYFETSLSNGLMSFDSFGVACVVLLQAITFDDWATPMYHLMAATSPSAWIYFAFVLAIGTWRTMGAEPMDL